MERESITCQAVSVSTEWDVCHSHRSHGIWTNSPVIHRQRYLSSFTLKYIYLVFIWITVVLNISSYKHCSTMYNSERITETSIDQNQTYGCGSDVNSYGTEQYKNPTDPIQRGPSRRIVLHFDLNNTVLVSDAVTRQGTEAALEYFLSTVTWGRMTKGKTPYLTRNPQASFPDNSQTGDSGILHSIYLSSLYWFKK